MSQVVNAHEIIRYPVNTEKARIGWAENASGRWYTFVVAPNATKAQIKAAIEEVFKENKVKVKQVRTQSLNGKFRRRRQHGGYMSDTKRAIVTLEPGQKIDFFDGI